MLAGPVTILNWSFPRKDISRSAQAYQLALALREEVADLESAGCKVIQVLLLPIHPFIMCTVPSPCCILRAFSSCRRQHKNGYSVGLTLLLVMPGTQCMVHPLGSLQLSPHSSGCALDRRERPPGRHSACGRQMLT